MMETIPEKKEQRNARGHSCRARSPWLKRKPWKLAVLTALVVAGFFVPAGVKSLLMVMFIYAVFAMAYDVLLGFANQASLGQSLFFGLGTYALVLPIQRLGASFWEALAFAIAAGLVVAFFVGLLAVRVTEAYHVILTAIIAYVAYLLAKNMTHLTGGSGGLPTEIPPILLGPLRLSVYDPTTCYFILLAFALAVYLVLDHLVHSPLGKVWVGIRENEVRSSFLRYNVFYYKLAAFVLAGAVTALSGALYALRLHYASAEFFAFNWSVLPFVWGVLGGFGTLIGPVMGVALFTLFQFYVSDWWTYYLIVFGGLIIVMLRWAPKGIMGHISALQERHEGPDREDPGPAEALPEPTRRIEVASPGRGRADMGVLERTIAEEKKPGRASDGGRRPRLETIDLVIRFGGMTVLNGVNMKVLDGEIRAIIGPNGAGKTTLFNAVTGAVRPTGGRVLLHGEDVTGFPPHRICRNGIARTFQIPNIFSELSVKENVWLGVNSKGRAPWSPLGHFEKRTASSREAEKLCEMTRLEDKMHAVAGSLSHGDQRLLEIAVALSVDPDILLLDEPTQGVDPREVENVAKIVRSVARWKTVLMIDHNMATVLDIAQRVTVLDHGTVIAEGAPSEIIADERVQEVYLGIGRG